MSKGLLPAEVASLEVLLADLRGHPRLTAWEEGFCLSIQRSLATFAERAVFSSKQVAKLRQLKAKVEADEGDEVVCEVVDDGAPFD